MLNIPAPICFACFTIDRPNQVWGIDITYLRMGKGFMYLFNIIDWYSRKVIDYELSSTLEKGFVLKCLKRAFRRCKPEILNSDQGSHFNQCGLSCSSREGRGKGLDGWERPSYGQQPHRALFPITQVRMYLYQRI
ncbi:transposase [Paenibacillus mendelii]|uniref:Transposase n=1 Tax=Paenibacillus mendelii TaxID=206163 RepID=A0ABV6J753_9BACL